VDRRRRYDAIPQWLRPWIRGAGKLLPQAAYGKNFLRMLGRAHPLERFFDYNGAGPQYRRAFQPEWQVPDDVAFAREIFDGDILPDTFDCLSQAMYFEATAKLAGDILVKVDRMSMANSLEVRCPLLDHRLAELASTIPNHWKTRGGKGKLILIEALGDRLPPALLTRPKRGFGVPLAVWFRGQLKDFLADHLRSREFIDRGLVRPARIDVILEEHWRGRRNHSSFLWMLLALELWNRAQSDMGPPKTYPLCISGVEL
jgi:asparagine synthase (glutamine-hydrolysing)